MKALPVQQTSLREGLRRTPEFEKKGLAQFSVNVGVKCGHGCTYCSSGALLRCHPAFKAAGESPFRHGAQQYDLGRRCLEAILGQPGWTVRILTKNAAVVRDFDLLEQHRDRVLLALSLTAPVENEQLARVIEPHASPISERMAAMRQAHELGLRVTDLPSWFSW